MKTLYSCILALFFANCLVGQTSPYVTNTPTVLPQLPTSSSQVTIITEATTANSGFKISSFHSVNHANKTILLEGCYYGGMLTALKTYVDTFKVGTLQGGLYSVVFKASESSTTPSCTPVSVNSITTSINVTGLTTSVKSASNVYDVSISPNPVKQRLNISQANEFTRVEIYAINGSKVKTFKNNSDNEYDVSELSDGIYILQLSSRDKIATKRFVKCAAE